MKRLLSTGLVALVLASAPDLLLACERCFGAGTDAPAVRAVTASMMALFVLMTGVFAGIVSFFRNVSARAAELESSSFPVDSNTQ